MKRILIVGILLLGVFVVVFRQRIYVRDPLGKVERSGVAQDGTRLYINYSNDVLVEDAERHQFVLVQGWSAAAWGSAAPVLPDWVDVLDGCG